MHADLPHVEIFADPILNKVFYNLLDNVVRHGQKARSITVSAREVPEGLIIFWEDDGIGIPANEKEKIFSQEIRKAYRTRAVSCRGDLLCHRYTH